MTDQTGRDVLYVPAPRSLRNAYKVSCRVRSYHRFISPLYGTVRRKPLDEIHPYDMLGPLFRVATDSSFQVVLRVTPVTHIVNSGAVLLGERHNLLKCIDFLVRLR